MDLFPLWWAFGDAVVIHDETEFILPLKPVQQQLLPTNSDKSIHIHTTDASRNQTLRFYQLCSTTGEATTKISSQLPCWTCTCVMLWVI